jgi:hypothetical protein
VPVSARLPRSNPRAVDPIAIRHSTVTTQAMAVTPTPKAKPAMLIKDPITFPTEKTA